MHNIFILFFAGSVGALIKDILIDNSIELPKITQGKMFLGFLGSMILGGIAGYYVDGSPLTAAMAGFSGYAVISNLIAKNGITKNSQTEIIKSLIRYEAQKQGVDPELAIKVAGCESNFSPTAKHTNTDGSIDRGLFQWNDKWHPEVSDEVAFDIILSTREFCKAFKNGNLHWWNTTKKCWNS